MCKMKIGILTFHRPINYGAFLQSYGLSKRLAKDFPDAQVEVIDYIAPLEKKKIYRNVLRRLKRNGVSGAFAEIKKIGIFKQALKDLSLSERYICDDSLEKLFEYIDVTYDVLIIGSDAVFNWKQNGYPTAFIPNYAFSIPVLSYAASVHGLHYYDEPKERILQCGTIFENMAAVFVRDECTRKFVKYCSNNLQVDHSCDPTFLIDFDELYKIKHRSLKTIKEKYGVKGKYIVLMLQDEKISKEVYERYNKEFTIVSLFLMNKYSDCFMSDLTPVEWCEVLKNAEVTVTSYFHGTLLSLEQSTPAMVVDVSNYGDPYEGKLDDLINRRIELPDLYYQSGNWDTKKEQFFMIFDKCLNGDYLNSIQKGVANERKSYDAFLTAIEKAVGGDI